MSENALPPAPCSACLGGSAASAYDSFHSKRLQNLEEYVKKAKQDRVKRGWNDSPSVEWECRYEGIKRLSGFSERDVWDAAWDAALSCLPNPQAEGRGSDATATKTNP